MKEITVGAVADDYYIVSNFVGAILESLHCPPKIQTKLDIAIDEIFGNIVKYSGAETITIRGGTEDDGMFVLIFIDDGTHYNPLDRPNPDINADFEDRPIGGLGIFIVKKSMDEVFYEYKGGHNCLTIKKKL